MKKSIVFKSLFAGIFALSTFTAQANGLFNLGRNFVRRATTTNAPRTAWKAIKNNPIKSTLFSMGAMNGAAALADNEPLSTNAKKSPSTLRAIMFASAGACSSGISIMVKARRLPSKFLGGLLAAATFVTGLGSYAEISHKLDDDEFARQLRRARR